MIRWMREVLSAVEHLHGVGLIHRDLKPENLLLAGELGKRFFSTPHQLVSSSTPG